MKAEDGEPKFFARPEEFREWLAAHHNSAQELWVGFYKRESGLPSLTWPESVDQALCFGWIDGIRKRIDGMGYKIRFTPRKSRSKWSAVNERRVAELILSGAIHEAGLKAFEARVSVDSGHYSYEQRHLIELGPQQQTLFRKNKKAWAFFSAQTPSYRKAALWWVVSAKREQTRAKRLAQLIADSAEGQAIAPLRRT